MDCSGIGDSLPKFEEPPKKVCPVCQAPAEIFCSDCLGVYYCSNEHQKSHWKDHEQDCPPTKVVTSPELGPHFVAARDLPPWTLLLTELPVLVNPLVILKDTRPSCISCRSILPLAPWTCTKCSTSFFCNQSCSMNKVHSEFECGILSKCSVEQRDQLCMMTNLGYLRALHLKNSNSESWTKVLKLRGTDQYTRKDADEDDEWFIREILPLIVEKGVGFEEDMTKLKGIIQQSAIVVHPIGNHGKSQFLYLRASEFAHNCFPNCTRIIGKGPSFQLQVRNTVEVKKGQILSIDFLGLSYDIGAIARQHMWHKIKGALCICPRCSDPTELGTMQSAVKCTQKDCLDGYLLPVDPMNMANDALWRCNRTGCQGKKYIWKEITEITSKFEREIARFQDQVLIEDNERTNEFWETLKKSLHPNHYIVVGFERELVFELNSQMMDQKTEFSLPRLYIHIAMNEHLLKMAEMIDPGLSQPRGILLNLLFNGYKNIVLKEPDRKKRSLGSFKTGLMIEKLLSIAQYGYYPDTWTPSDIQSLIDYYTAFYLQDS